MTDSPTPYAAPQAVSGGVFALVFLLSASVLAFEVSLMRMLLVAGWHHFAFLVISVALLGFGASGVFLYLFRRRILPHGARWLFGLTLAAAIAMPVCAALVQNIPVESRFLPALLTRQIGWWLAYWLILLIPFWFGAAAIGLALMLSGRRVSTTYASNLSGSAAGALLVNGLIWGLNTPLLATGCGAIALSASLCAPTVNARTKGVATFLIAAFVAVWYTASPPNIRTDPYKYHTFIKQLQRQGLAERIAETTGPKGVVSVYQSDLFHDLPFLSGTTAPPPISVILLDGHLAAGVLDADTPEQAAVVRQVLTAAAYELAPAHPAVLLPDERGTANIWLAAVNDAKRIDVVHHHPRIAQMLRRELKDSGGGVLDRPGVTYHNAYPRHFIDNTPQTYDVIQLVGLEALPAGSGGIAGLGQNHLMTVEGITAALTRLSPDGLLVAARGIQDPPRDNLKIMALFAEALRQSGIDDPGRHIVIIRDFLAVCTLVKSTPWTDEQLQHVADLLQRRNLTGVWFTDIPDRYLNRPDWLPGPSDDDDHIDWFHYAAQHMFGDEPQAFIDDWFFDIRPPVDNRPFFYDFSKLAAIQNLREAFGDMWLTRTEIAFLFVLGALVGVGGAAVILTIIPLLFVRPGCGLRTLAPAAGYFSCLGLAYLMLEITLLAKLTRLIGDPMQAAATTIAAFLFFSGLGSLTAQRCRLTPAFLRRIIVALAVTAVLCIVALPPVAHLAGRLHIAFRMPIAAALIAPLAFLMGFPMPSGLSRLHHGPRQLIAWAWGINGFASVLAAPTATLIAMVWGFTYAAAVAVALYLVAALLFACIPVPLANEA